MAGVSAACMTYTTVQRSWAPTNIDNVHVNVLFIIKPMARPITRQGVSSREAKTLLIIMSECTNPSHTNDNKHEKSIYKNDIYQRRRWQVLSIIGSGLASASADSRDARRLIQLYEIHCAGNLTGANNHAWFIYKYNYRHQTSREVCPASGGVVA